MALPDPIPRHADAGADDPADARRAGRACAAVVPDTPGGHRTARAPDRAPGPGPAVDALRARRREVEYLVFDDEGHTIENPDNRIALFRAVERFLARHLGGRG
jgi:hypothetical protein